MVGRIGQIPNSCLVRNSISRLYSSSLFLSKQNDEMYDLQHLF